MKLSNCRVAAHLKPVVPRRQDERFHEVEVVVVAGGGGVRFAAPDESGLEEAAAHHHGVQDHDLVPRHVDVQALMGTRKNRGWLQIFINNVVGTNTV